MNKFVIFLICLGISQSYGQDDPGVHLKEMTSCERVYHLIDIIKSENEHLKLRLEKMDHHFERQRQHQHEVYKKVNSLEETIQRLQIRLLEQQNDNHNEVKEILKSMESKECFQRPSQNNEDTEILNELRQVSKVQDNILKKINEANLQASNSQSIRVNTGDVEAKTNEIEGINVCWGVYTKILGELNSNITILQNIDSKLSKLNDHYEDESEKHKKTIAVTHGLLKYLNKREEAKICIRSNDQKLVCTPEPYPTSCADYDSTHCSKGKCRIKNLIYGPETFVVPCDDTTEGGGWTVIQRRINGATDFYRGWSEYKDGFGSLDGEFWLGLDKIHALTSSLAPVELLIQMKDHNDTTKYAKYSKFLVGSELELYELKEADGHNGTTKDSFGQHKGCKFSTKDKDNDASSTVNCAIDKRGAWWYNACMWSNLNGVYYKTGIVPKNETGRGICWGYFNGYQNSMKFVQMMIRPNKN